MTAVLKSTSFPELGERREGKVRDIYVQEGRLVLIATDRHSSFDRIIAHIPGKGEVLNRISLFWFEQTRDIVQNHVLEAPDPNAIIARRCMPLPIEVVMRGYLTGVTGTSIWTHYQKGRRDFGNFTLPDGMKKNQKLDKPVFTPSTKENEHDRTVTPDEIIAMGQISRKQLQEIEEVAHRLFARGQELARQKGLILVDTKYELGLDEAGKLTLIDEVHTPDSSRYWFANSYDERFAAGKEPEYFDKEFLRLWFMSNCDPYNDPVLPEAPPAMVEELAGRYGQVFNLLTGENISQLAPGESIEGRLRKNLAPYAKAAA
ncbi:MAG: phosphoribosylaminoimidazolesuccinocarboxamide synthase [Alphaproteobacteria bacterium]|nr:phosphoribosylaminoimidazolesuccinocarboxamide synthase [Alphaproteobacteria bacterium]